MTRLCMDSGIFNVAIMFVIISASSDLILSFFVTDATRKTNSPIIIPIKTVLRNTIKIITSCSVSVVGKMSAPTKIIHA